MESESKLKKVKVKRRMKDKDARQKWKQKISNVSSEGKQRLVFVVCSVGLELGPVSDE